MPHSHDSDAVPDMTSFPTTLYGWDDVPSDKVTDSPMRRLVTGERMMVVHLRLEEGAFVPVHSHESEQPSRVLEGALRFVIGPEPGGQDEGPEDVRGSKAGGDEIVGS